MPAFELRIGALSEDVKHTIADGIEEHTMVSLGVNGYSPLCPSHFFFVDSLNGPLVALECRLFWGSVLFKTIYEAPHLIEAERNVLWKAVFDEALHWGKKVGCTRGLVLYAFQPSFVDQLLKYGFLLTHVREGWKESSNLDVSQHILSYDLSSLLEDRLSYGCSQVQKMTLTSCQQNDLPFTTQPLWEQTAPPMSFEYWHKDQLASAVAVGKRFDQWCIYLTYTNACSRGLGLAGNLLHQSLQWIQGQGGKFVDVETFSYQALPFYLKHHFVPDYTLTGLYADASLGLSQVERKETSFIFLRRYLKI